MQHSSSRMCAAVWQGFRPHLHRSPCVICAAARATCLPGVEHVCTSSFSSSSTACTQPVTAAADNATPNVEDKGVPNFSYSSSLSSSASFIELRRNALLQWLQTFSEKKRLCGVVEVRSKDDCKSANSSSILPDAESFTSCYNAYLRCDDPCVEKQLYTTLLETLDNQSSCREVPQSGKKSSSQESTESTTERQSSTRIPTRLVVPQAESSLSTSTLPASAGGNRAATNVFETHVRQLFPSDSAAVLKQLAFQEALLSFKEVLDRQGVTFFLACGTALGARRNNCFIPYDEDIDLGILYTDFFSSVPPSGKEALAEEASLQNSLSVASELHRVQDRLFLLIHALASTGVFLIFDVCGTVEKGLELRVLHTPTNTRIDLNLYYPPVPGSDDALVQRDGPFVWASSFYEAANRRAHQMYRYRHRPFEKELTRLPFCVRTSDAVGFWVPPERYLVENYGNDWRTPKQYTYTEGLEKEFKNIINE